VLIEKLLNLGVPLIGDWGLRALRKCQTRREEYRRQRKKNAEAVSIPAAS
jgi:hypothetical protein